MQLLKKLNSLIKQFSEIILLGLLIWYSSILGIFIIFLLTFLIYLALRNRIIKIKPLNARIIAHFSSGYKCFRYSAFVMISLITCLYFSSNLIFSILITAILSAYYTTAEFNDLKEYIED